jgi:hypothetical protein
MPLTSPNPQDTYLLTRRSSNRKVGKGSPVSMSTMATCPPACKLREGCYATCGRLGLIWWKLSEGKLVNDVGFTEFCGQVRDLDESVTIWRHNQAGDLPGKNNRLNKRRCLQLARANAAGGRNRGGYTYTHYPVLPTPGVPMATIRHNREVIKAMNDLGFAVNVSADKPGDVDAMLALGIGPVVTLLPMDCDKGFRTAEGALVIPCPAVLRHEVNCVECKICQKGERKSVVGFPAHGTSKKRVDKLAREG